MTWGVYQMTEGFRSRWNYLYCIFYRLKPEYIKTISFLFAFGFGIISPLPYSYDLTPNRSEFNRKTNVLTGTGEKLH